MTASEKIGYMVGPARPYVQSFAEKPIDGPKAQKRGRISSRGCHARRRSQFQNGDPDRFPGAPDGCAEVLGGSGPQRCDDLDRSHQQHRRPESRKPEIHDRTHSVRHDVSTEAGSARRPQAHSRRRGQVAADDRRRRYFPRGAKARKPISDAGRHAAAERPLAGFARPWLRRARCIPFTTSPAWTGFAAPSPI